MRLVLVRIQVSVASVVTILMVGVAPTCWPDPVPFVPNAIPTANPSSFPQHLYATEDALYFVADDGIHGRELWAWQGETEDGIGPSCFLVADIAIGEEGSDPERMTDVNGWLYFIAGTVASQSQRTIWIWDMEQTNLRHVTKASGGDDLIEAHFFGMVGDRVCFSAWRVGRSLELFSTEPGTTVCTAISGLTKTPGGEILRATVLEDRYLFYYTADSVKLTDATKSGTRVVHHFAESNSLFLTGAMSALGGQVVFVGTDDVHGGELWTTDGTVSGTRLLKDIAPGLASSGVTGMVRDGSGRRLYFGADDMDRGRELWTTDGTADGTVLVKDINAGRAHSEPYAFVSNGSWVYFLAQDAEHGRELWRTDGTSEGTAMVVDLYPGIEGSEPWRPVSFDGTLFFCANSPTYGEEVFMTDGTERGTRVLKDIVPGIGSSGPHQLTVFKDSLFFTCNDGIHGEELWMTDGTADGTRLAADIYPLRFNPSSSPHDLTAMGGLLVFAVRDAEHGEEVWVSDGSAVGTRMLRDIAPGTMDSNPTDLMATETHVFFTAGDGASGWGLWSTDGTVTGTRPLLDAASGAAGDDLELAFTTQALAFFTRGDEIHGQTIGRSDGTAAGTIKLLEEGERGRIRRVLRGFELNGKIFFYTKEADENVCLWVTDGTREGTIRVTREPISPFPFVADGASVPAREHRRPDTDWVELSSEERLRIGLLCPPRKAEGAAVPLTLGEFTYFVARTANHGTELWKTDGTPSGTGIVLDVFPGPPSSGPSDLTAVDGRLYFIAEHPRDGRVLWETDGTADGTGAVTLLTESGASFTVLASALSAVGDTLVMCSLPSLDRKSAPHNAELRFMNLGDGTRRSEDALEALRAGSEGSWPGHLTRVGNRVFFTADDGIHGEELWVTDGTPGGTRLIKDILVPGDLVSLAGRN